MSKISISHYIKSLLETIKKPLSFVLIFLFALLALNFLDESKTVYDKKMKAPFVIISDDDKALNELADSKSPDKTFIFHTIKEDKLKSLILPAGAETEGFLEKQNLKIDNIFGRSIKEISYKEYDESKLVSALSDSLSKQKDEVLKAVKDNKQKTDANNLDSTVFKSDTVTSEEVSSAFIGLNKRIYNSLVVDGKFFRDKKPAPSGLAYVIFDESKHLSIVYKFLWIALSGIIVFALLYLILIPLKYVFFWTTSGDTLTEHAKKFLEKKDFTPSGAPFVTRAILAATATVATVAIGTTAIVSNAFAEDKDPKNPILVAASRTPNFPITDKSPNPYVSPSPNPSPNNIQPDINALTENLSTLNGTVGKLGEKVDILANKQLIDPNFEKLQEQYAALVNRELNLVKDIMRDPKNPNEAGTLFNALRNVPSSINYSIDKKFENVIGIPNSLSKGDTLFGRVNTLSGDLTTTNSIAKAAKQSFETYSSIPQNISDISNFIGKRTDPVTENTLFGLAKNNQESINSVKADQVLIKEDSGTIRKRQLESNRGFYNKVKGIFQGNSYRLNKFAFDELKKVSGSDSQFEKALEKALKETATRDLTEEEFSQIFKRPKNFDERKWKDWRRLAFRYARLQQ